MKTLESGPDRGFRRAGLCGLVSFLACVMVWTVASGGSPPPEAQGRLFASCLIPAVLVGWAAAGRRWSWTRVAVTYTVVAVALVAVAALPRSGSTTTP